MPYVPERTRTVFKSQQAAEYDREVLRKRERLLDQELRRNPPPNGRVWSEHEPGFHGLCAACGRLGRRWRGACFVYSRAPGLMPYSIHSTEPLCAFDVIKLQSAEIDAGLHHWRPAPAARAV